MNDRIYVLDLDNDEGELVNSPISDKFTENVMHLVNLGFKIGSKSRLEALQKNEIPFDTSKPDAAMVASGDQSSLIKNGVAFLHAHPEMEDSAIFVYTALDANTPKDVVDSIQNNFGGYFHQPSEGEPHSGYICLQQEKPSPGELTKFDNPFEAAARAFNETGVETVPLKADPNGVGLFPMYLKDGGAFADMSPRAFNSSQDLQEQVAEELTTYLGAEVFGLDLNDAQELAALNKQEGLLIAEPQFDDRYRPDTRMRMGV